MSVSLTLAALVFAIRPLSVAYPGSGLDDSWIAVLGEATNHPVRWGVDLAFSYGPASTLLTRYLTGRYFAVNLPFWALAAVVSGTTSALLIRCLGQALAAPILAFGVLQALALASQAGQDMDAFVFSLAFNLYLLDLVRSDRSAVVRCVLLCGAALLGVLALAKTSIGLFGLIFMVLADCRSVAARRRAWLALTFLAAGLVGFVALGQNLADLPTFVATQWCFAAGYADAMSISGYSVEVLAYLAAGIALVALAAMAGPGHRGLWPSLGVASALFLGLKAGFVRADAHTQIAWSLLALTGLSVAVALVLPRSTRAAGALAAVCLALLWIWSPLILILDTHRPKELGTLAAVYEDTLDAALAEWSAWVRWLPDPRAFAEAAQADKALAWADLRDQDPLPAFEGTVDVMASRQSSVLANRLDFHPRPSFQEYATYDGRLIAANAAFYAGESRPDWVLFGLKPIDSRYPALMEGALWPMLLSRYELAGQTGSLMALRARRGPTSDALGAPQHATLMMGTAVAPPDGTLFVRAIVKKTLLGRVASLLFRIPGITLEITTADGKDQTYRLIPSIAERGFLLSPAIANVGEFAALANGQPLPDRRVVAISIASWNTGWSLFYDPEVKIDFQTVSHDLTPLSIADRAMAQRLGLKDPR